MRLRRIEPVLRRALRGVCALPRGSRLLVAVSGGADSTALLAGLRALAPSLGLTLHAAHLDHGLRGAESRADAEACRALCARLGVPLTRGRIDARAALRRRGLSGEDGLRRLRRGFLARAAERAGAVAIATAHTADDQLETLLLRLLRGTGLVGLGGIRPRRGRWLRPLLGATRDDIEADLREAGLGWREDASNRDPSFTRNRVRHGVVPALLAALGPSGSAPGARGRLALRAARAAFDAAEAVRALRVRAAALLCHRSRIQAVEARLDARGWGTYPAAIRRLALGLLWARHAPGAGGLTARHLDALDRLAGQARGGSRVMLPGGRVAERDRGVVRLRMEAPGPIRRPARVLRVPGRLRWGEEALRGRWATGAVARRRAAAGGSREEFFAADGLHGELVVREGRPDEWFVPFGRTRPVRLGAFLRGQAVTREQRAHPTVLADNGGILWVVGVRRAARAAIGPATRRALRVHMEAHD